MPQFKPGTYIIVPKDADPKTALGIGSVIEIYPPPDVPVRILGLQLVERWVVKASENNTFTVFAGRGLPNDYKWTVEKDNDLFVTSVGKPLSFRFESAGDDLWTIGLFGQDAVLTADKKAFPQLSFKHADGSDAQRFKAVQVHVPIHED